MYWLHSVTATYDPEDVLPLADVKQDLDVDHSDDDALITAHRDSAIDFVEDYTGRFLGPKEVVFLADQIRPAGLLLPFDPVSEVTALEVGGEAVVGWTSIPGAANLLLPPAGTRWPAYCVAMGSVRATYTAGYPLDECPPILLQGVKLMVGIFYDRSRDPEKDTEAVKNLLRPKRYGIGT